MDDDHVPIPARIMRLPVDSGGRPVPYFVARPDGKPDFRLTDEAKLVSALRLGLCFTCGERLGATKAFLVGPLCVATRLAAEPPSHVDCLRYAVQVCPFLTKPDKVRRESGLPDEKVQPGGVLSRHNPGAEALYITRTFATVIVADKFAVRMGPPTSVEWWAAGGAASRDQVLAAIESGLPALREHAAGEGSRAVEALEGLIAAAIALAPV